MIVRILSFLVIISLLVPVLILGCSDTGNSMEDKNMFPQSVNR